MNFLEKLDFMMNKLGINKRGLSEISGVPYTTIDTFYKKGYENTKLSTVRKLAESLDVSMDYLLVDTITDEDYGKTSSFTISSKEQDHIKKYRILDHYGKEAVDGVLDVESRRCEAAKAAHKEHLEQATETLCERREQMEAAEAVFILPYYLHPSSAGTGEYSDRDEWEELTMTKRPPRGASYVIRVHGDSMEPTYYDGDKVFVRAGAEVRIGQVGIFVMGGEQYIKELGDGVLISHNPDYKPRQFMDGIQFQGLVLGVCDKSYFE